MRSVGLARALACGFALLCGGLFGCESLQSYTGSWQGQVSADPQLRQGFDPEARLQVTIASLEPGGMQTTVVLPGALQPLPFEPIRRASADALGALSLPGDSLRTYLGYVRPPGQEPHLVVLTLFPHETIEARVIRGPDETYGVFRLGRR